MHVKSLSVMQRAIKKVQYLALKLFFYFVSFHLCHQLIFLIRGVGLAVFYIIYEICDDLTGEEAFLNGDNVIISPSRS